MFLLLWWSCVLWSFLACVCSFLILNFRSWIYLKFFNLPTYRERLWNQWFFSINSMEFVWIHVSIRLSCDQFPVSVTTMMWSQLSNNSTHFMCVLLFIVVYCSMKLNPWVKWVVFAIPFKSDFVYSSCIHLGHKLFYTGSVRWILWQIWFLWRLASLSFCFSYLFWLAKLNIVNYYCFSWCTMV